MVLSWMNVCLLASLLLVGVGLAIFFIVRAVSKKPQREHRERRCYGCGARLALGSVSRLCERCQSKLSAPSDSSNRPESLVSVSPVEPGVADIRAGPPPLPGGFKAQTPREEAATTPHVGAPAAPAVADLAGRFPQLEILDLLGQGGMGTVYKARQTKLDRLVALKVLPSESARDPRFHERFQREARALAKLSHPGIVTIHDFGEIDGLVFFIMEYVDGANLRQVLRHGGLPPAHEALVIVSQVCDALQYAHDEGIIHRDIKPENILIDRKGRVKIADFGLAKLLGPEGVDFSLTGTHQAMGTVNYMAPEQMESAARVDHRADIYSLGVVLYEMLTGQLPRGRFPPPSEKAAVDSRLDPIVLRALESEPERRYQKVSEMQTEMEAMTKKISAQPATMPYLESAAVGQRTEGNTLKKPGRNWLGTSTGWAMFVCLGGIGTIFLPWFQVYFSGELGAVPRNLYGHVQGYDLLEGKLIVGLFAVLFLMLLVFGVIVPPFWQSVLVTFTGLLAGLLTLLAWSKESGGRISYIPAPEFFKLTNVDRVVVTPGIFCVLASVIALLGIGVTQFRNHLAPKKKRT